MIEHKLEIKYVIKSLNELEKLKMLLFDDDQHYVFEHIPKPYLIDGKIAKTLEENNDDNNIKSAKRKKISSSSSKKLFRFNSNDARKLKEKQTKKDILISNKRFWKNNVDNSTKMKHFSQALDNIKNKKNWNIIDERLLSLINEFSGNDFCDENLIEEKRRRSIFNALGANPSPLNIGVTTFTKGDTLQKGRDTLNGDAGPDLKA